MIGKGPWYSSAIKTYLDILNKTMTVCPLQKYSPSDIKEKQSVPKMQVYNNGFRNRYGSYTFDQARANPAEWGRQVESAVGAHLANRSVIDGFELLYWRNDKKQECDFVLKSGLVLIPIEVKSGRAEDISGYEKFKELYSDRVVSSIIVGPEGLPLEDFFQLDIKKLFKSL